MKDIQIKNLILVGSITAVAGAIALLMWDRYLKHRIEAGLDKVDNKVTEIKTKQFNKG